MNLIIRLSSSFSHGFIGLYKLIVSTLYTNTVYDNHTTTAFKLLLVE